MTQAQIDWASKHDWFRAPIPNGVLVVECFYSQNTCECIEQLRTFTDFQQLRNWAGY